MAFVVGDQYRTNELSLVPGGYVVCVRKSDGKVLEYDKIKKPYSYIRVISKKDDVIDAWLKSEVL